MRVDGLHEELTQLAEREEFSGVVRVESDHETVFQQAYGPASYTWDVPASLRTRFDTASITKLFTAVAVLQQVEAGKFALETSVVEFLGLPGTSIRRDATVHHMLSHTSGIGDDADEEAGEHYEALFRDRPNYAVRRTADLLPGFVQRPANFPPGEGCRYCNAAYVLLGLMVEKATGQAYRDYVAERVFLPAGMAGAGFFAMDRVTPDVAEGVEPVTDKGRRVGWRRNIYSYPPIGSPDGGAHVRAADLVAFHRSLLAGALVSADTVGAMLTPHARYRRRGQGAHWTGYGFELETYADDPDAPVRSYWKEGINVGVSGMLRHYPGRDGEGGVTVVVLSNLTEGAWEPLRRIDRRVGDSLLD